MLYPSTKYRLFRRMYRLLPVVKKFTKAGVQAGFWGLILILVSNIWVVFGSGKSLFFNIRELPTNDVGLVLGTNSLFANGRENLYFTYRMEAAALLYKEGKIKRLVLSGNNDSRYYNEPRKMQEALLALGVPGDALTLDFAGYRTFDSIQRCKQVFGIQSVTIISQPFHNYRALFLAKNLGMNAVAFAAKDVPTSYAYDTVFREYLARPKAIIDLFVFPPKVETDNAER